ncbi:MAG: glycoside hydrolase family 3 N-terminal domain-containing protein [bacterium]
MKQRSTVLIVAILVLAAAGVALFILWLGRPNMTTAELRQRIGQMLLVGFRGAEASQTSTIVAAIRDLNLGGVILFDIDVPSGRTVERNIVDPAQTRKLIADLQRWSPTSLWIAVDAEGGKVNRLKAKYGFLEIPSAEEMGRMGPAATREIADKLAGQLAELGFNLNFAPVVDVNVNPQNPVIGALGRSFSADPDQVTACAAAFIEGMHSQRIATSLKHFPGHGSSASDSHLGLVDITSSWTTRELIPYRDLISRGLVDMVMTAHVINRSVDPEYPATLSTRFIGPILREQFQFKGPVVSDDLEMGAITQNFGFEEALVRAVNAGCDLLILSNNGSLYDDRAAYQAVEAIYQAVQSGKISSTRIWQSSERLRTLKEAFGVLPAPTPVETGGTP